MGGWVAGLLENKANLNSSFSLVEVEVWVELGNIQHKTQNTTTQKNTNSNKTQNLTKYNTIQ